jgi:hypothetical protein
MAMSQQHTQEELRQLLEPGFIMFVHNYFSIEDRAITKLTYQRMLDSYIEGAKGCAEQRDELAAQAQKITPGEALFIMGNLPPLTMQTEVMKTYPETRTRVIQKLQAIIDGGAK